MWQVNTFIARFQHYHAGRFDSDVLYDVLNAQFCRGYCWHFATILQSVFKRGVICQAWPFAHIVWQDTDGLVWDFNGLYDGEAEFFIPFDWIVKRFPSAAKSYIHYDYNDRVMPDEARRENLRVGRLWCIEKGLRYDNKITEYFFS